MATAFRWLIVVLLLLSATAKGHAAFNDAAYFGQFDAATAGLIIVEFIVAAMLLMREQSPFGWWLSSGLFFIFAMVNVRSVWIGQQSCGCLGDISVGPKLMLTLDLVIAGGSAWLAYFIRPTHKTPLWLSLRSPLKLAFTMLLLAVGCDSLLYAGGRASLLPSAGLVSTSQPLLADISDSQKKSGVLNLPLANASGQTIRIIGMHVGCDTAILTQLPISVQSGQAVTLKLWTALPEYVGESRMATTFYTADAPALEQDISVRVIHE